MAKTFVFEGSDLVGKSTTARAIAEKNSFRLERNVTVHDAYQLVASICEDIERARVRNSCGGTTTLFDRWQLVSDIVYNDCLFGSYSRVLPFINEFALECKKAGIYFIVLTCSDKEELTRRYNHRGDDDCTLEEVLAVHEAYISFFTKGAGMRFPHVIIDVTDKSIAEVINEVEGYIRRLGGMLDE